MNETSMQFVLAHLEATKYRWPKVAAATGVPVKTIRRMAAGETKSPRISTLEILVKYFREQAAA
jgi:hypothetical protein